MWDSRKPQFTTARVGQRNVRLKCNICGLPKKSFVKWTFGEDGPRDFVVDGLSLFFYVVRKENLGYYTCKVSNEARTPPTFATFDLYLEGSGMCEVKKTDRRGTCSIMFTNILLYYSEIKV